MRQVLGTSSFGTQVDGRLLFALEFGQSLITRQVLVGLLSLLQSPIQLSELIVVLGLSLVQTHCSFQLILGVSQIAQSQQCLSQIEMRFCPIRSNRHCTTKEGFSFAGPFLALG